jgi:glucokinase-like ROK family protein
MAPRGAPSTFDLDLDGANYLAQIITFVRGARSVARPEISISTGLSRGLSTKYIDIAIELNLLRNGEVGLSSGGRAPRLVNFNSSAGAILVAELGATGFSVAVSDLYGGLLSTSYIPADISKGPEEVLALVEKSFDELVTNLKIKNLWGIGIGVPGPVEFATGLPISPPIMPGWDKFPLRERFASKYNVPVWVDNDVNLMALGEHALRKDPITNEFIFVKIGSGIGAGILTHGQLHRGAQGCAGDIGHIAISAKENVQCRCGNLGCLEAVSGGLALIRDAELAAINNESSYLGTRKKAKLRLKVEDVIQGANNGDRWCVERIIKAGNDLGGVLATLVNFHNPSLIVIGGSVSAAGDKLLASIRETVLNRSLPLATRDLQIRISESSDEAGLVGAVEMVITELFSSENLRKWVAVGRPSQSSIQSIIECV